jgi:hypothetical protein
MERRPLSNAYAASATANELAEHIAAFLEVSWRKRFVLSGPTDRGLKGRQVNNRRHGDGNPFLFGADIA